jgi:hypothetical protein
MLQSVLITLTQKEHQKAYQIAKREKTEHDREQQYKNILVLLAGQSFLNAFGFESKIDPSLFNTSLKPEFNNQHLYLPTLKGFLQCYPLSKDQTNFPLILPNDPLKLGYLFIEIDTPYTKAEIIGFLPQKGTIELDRSHLQSINILLKDLISSSNPPPVLSHWLQGSFKDWIPQPSLLQRIQDLNSEEIPDPN